MKSVSLGYAQQQEHFPKRVVRRVSVLQFSVFKHVRESYFKLVVQIITCLLNIFSLSTIWNEGSLFEKWETLKDGVL